MVNSLSLSRSRRSNEHLQRSAGKGIRASGGGVWVSLRLAVEGFGGWERVVSEPASFFHSDATKHIPLLAQNWLDVERAETKLKGAFSLGGLSHLQMEKCHIGS